MNSRELAALLTAAEDATRAGRREEALDLYGGLLEREPGHALAHYKRGNVLKDLARPEAAVASYDAAIALDPAYANAYCNRGVVLATLGRFEAARQSYDRAIALNPGDALAHYNRSAVLIELADPTEALASLDRAITINPTYAEAHCNRGTLLKQLKRLPEALASFDRALSVHPDFYQAHLQRGNLLNEQRAWVPAIQSFREALRLQPDSPFLRGVLQHCRMHLGDWTNLETELEQLTRAIEAGEAVSPPFPLAALLDSPRIQRKAAQIWVRECRAAAPLGTHAAGARLRVGFFSSDFHDHPVANLLAEVIELHDRSKYEFTAFAFGLDIRDSMRQRMESAFERFIDVRDKSDEEVVHLARTLNIDIALDLAGHTALARPMIFALRAAPIQINYLGYAGTLGAEFIDYLMADATVIPPSQREHYSEKIISLPDSLLPHDRTRPIATQRLSREELRLPPSGCVFCCFNTSYKITPEVFDSWMRILLRTGESVLWLGHNNDWATRNLKLEAAQRGVDPARLIFAERTASAALHLARFGMADLFLDTRPYNAHATAIDSLWAGVPVLTLIGASFASRVAASLLKAIELPELITTTPADYEDLAVRLANHPAELAMLKRKLAANRLTTALFDTRSFTRHLESAFTQVHQRQQAGLPPDHLEVPRVPARYRSGWSSTP